MTNWDLIPRMQNWLNIQKSITIIYHVNKVKHKNYDHLNKDAKKHLTKSSIHSWLKFSGIQE